MIPIPNSPSILSGVRQLQWECIRRQHSLIIRACRIAVLYLEDHSVRLYCCWIVLLGVLQLILSAVEVRTITNVAKGEELLISYCDIALPKSVRLSTLREAYCFDCSCPRCCGETNYPNLSYEEDSLSEERQKQIDEAIVKAESQLGNGNLGESAEECEKHVLALPIKERCREFIAASLFFFSLIRAWLQKAILSHVSSLFHAYRYIHQYWELGSRSFVLGETSGTLKVYALVLVSCFVVLATN